MPKKQIVTLHIVEHPIDQCYSALVHLALSRCTTFSLVWRKQDRKQDRFFWEQSAIDIERNLRRYLIKESVQTSGPKALVRHYRLDNKSAKELLQVNGLWDWIQPKYPEDLTFYLPNGQTWLASVGHEDMAWFEGESISIDEIQRSVPGIKVSARFPGYRDKS